MAELSGFPYFEVQFTKTGRVHDRTELDALLAHVTGDPAPTDLVVISHGWNNDMARARELYRDFFASLREVLDDPGVSPLGGRRPSVFGILWPSKKFADRELIPGGAAAAGGDISEAEIEDQLDELMDGFDAEDADERLARARELVNRLEDSPAACREFADELRALIEDETVAEDVELPDVGNEFLTLPGDELLERLGRPSLDEQGAGPAAGGGAAALGLEGTGDDAVGAAAGMRDFAVGVKAGARNFLNLLTYYKMKERAGRIGGSAVHEILGQLRAAKADIRLHLVGHSFGGRLVTAAVAGREGAPPVPVESMTLLQAAYSHHGLAENWDDEGHDGLFRRVLSEDCIRGPVLVTHTANDNAVGRAYPIASRLARQVASALGGPDDKYGGIGRNGALKTPEARFEELLEVGEAYGLAAGAVHNLKADRFISDHGDVANRQTAYAVWEAVRAT